MPRVAIHTGLLFAQKKLPLELYMMQIPLIAILLLGLTATANAADTSSCYAIAEADARTYCLALAHNDPGRCYAIQDSAMRSRCMAEVRQ
ncbi:MAG: hypothetical protein CVV07_13170 [Gammaproteobacteria bacterium HGW-Gammaproteobacteria-11]|nr:MAG: hypothetical protein CVV07_13170 [Gammaproteobacteria bacterium HGW-Gammaproteobacteria-11]